MSDEVADAAAEFERAANWLRGELRGIAAALTHGAEPEVEEWNQERRTTRGAMGRQFMMRMTLPDAAPDAAAAASAVMTAAGWSVETSEDASGTRLKGQQGGFQAGVFLRPFGGVSVWGQAPTVWFHSHWIRPPRAATPETLMPGYGLCRMCDGWGTCIECEGLGFVDGRQCLECGLGMDCSYCAGSGQQRLNR
ncbi:hypothetical protein [Streptomyces sp. NPDC058486]|uniref:hypothetical protein n=1 Tax=unclassified Streptomyces TaxID=2593676 RepID=UPI00364A5155